MRAGLMLGNGNGNGNGNGSGAATRQRVPGPASATRVTVAALGAVIALAGVEHGIGELLQGNAPPPGLTILSWPDAEPFRLLAGEPAMTIVPSLAASGVLAIAVSLLVLVWAAAYAGRPRGGPVLIALSVAMLLVGGGIGPPLIGVLLGAAATRIHGSLSWWRTHVPRGVRRALASSWPPILAGDIAAWLGLFPGVVVGGYLLGAEAVPPALAYALMLAAFVLLPLSIVAAFARDAQRRLEAVGLSGAPQL